MSKMDELIDDVLAERDPDLADGQGGQRGFVGQALASLTGPWGWAAGVAAVGQAAAGIGAAIALWQCLSAASPLAAVHWGVGAVMLLQITGILKGFLGNHMEANRLVSDIRRLELRIVRAQGDAPGLGGQHGVDQR